MICKLTIIEGPGDSEGQVFLVFPDEPRVLGRSVACDLILGDEKISSVHAQVLFKGDDFFVKDLLSRNGITLNDRLVHFSSLEAGDVIRLGRTKFEVGFEEGGKSSSEQTSTIFLAEDDAGEEASCTQEVVEPVLLDDDDDEVDKTPMGRLLRDSRDLDIARMALRSDMLTHRQLKECLDIQREMAEVKIDMPLAEILEERDFLDAAQITRLGQDLDYQRLRARDVLYAKVAVTNGLTNEERASECLRLQADSYIASEGKNIPRVSEIMIRKGYISTKDSNRLVKAISSSRSASR